MNRPKRLNFLGRFIFAHMRAHFLILQMQPDSAIDRLLRICYNYFISKQYINYMKRVKYYEQYIA